ncbi:MAG TPA: alpha/beta fold hydrolase [Blastocatellia bacterium]|nr:alpha/beta fold hydrolase [Blastocatellia bacterium]
MRTAKMSGCSFSPDERSILITSNLSGSYNAYLIPLSGGPPRPLFEETGTHLHAISYFPHDHRVLVQMDLDGQESAHLGVLEPDGRTRVLTSGHGVQALFRGWSADGKFFYCSTNEREAHRDDLYKISTDDYRSTPFNSELSDRLDFHGFSPDERYAVFDRNESDITNILYLKDHRTGELFPITPETEGVLSLPVGFDPESSSLYFLTNEDDEFLYLARYELKTGRSEVFRKYPGDVRLSRLSRRGRYCVSTYCAPDGDRVEIYDFESGLPLRPRNLPEGEIRSVYLSNSERFMVLYVGHDRAPNDLYLHDLETGETRRLTDNLNPEIDPEDLVESRPVSFRSFDGLEIPCLLWRPHGASAAHRVPALVLVHGGPGGRTRRTYNGTIQFLVNRGYAVLGVNHRGSSGSGRTFYEADVKKQGREPLWDCIEARRYLSGLDFIRPDRIGIIGGSFGGYMVLAALTFHPDEFAAGVDICGISNWLRAIDSLPPTWESGPRRVFLRKVGDPETDYEMLRSISPVYHADRIRAPLMILQGALDPRVPRIESDDMVETIRRHAGTVEYLVFPDEAHGFRRRSNSILAYRAIADFLDRHLKG